MPKAFSWLARINKYSEQTKTLMQINADAVRHYNATMLKKVLFVGLLLSYFAFVIGFFRPDMRQSQLGYLICAVVFTVLVLVYRGNKNDKYALLGLYAVFVMFYGLVLYLSCFVFDERYAATALSFFCVAPLVFVDKPLRKDGFILLLYLLLTSAAFYFKETSIAGVDAVNCAISALLGISIGRVMLRDRLENFEANRLLKIERETDVLTGVYNRRKLFDEIAAVKAQHSTLPSAILMIDIDKFKQINDTYGHETGDNCLRAFGRLMRSYRGKNAEFYRYGGEEFICFMYDIDRDGVNDTAEQLLAKAAALDVCACPFTVSIGAVLCTGSDDCDCDYYIRLADKAAYAAKDSGRNSLVFSN